MKRTSDHHSTYAGSLTGSQVGLATKPCVQRLSSSARAGGNRRRASPGVWLPGMRRAGLSLGRRVLSVVLRQIPGSTALVSEAGADGVERERGKEGAEEAAARRTMKKFCWLSQCAVETHGCEVLPATRVPDTRPGLAGAGRGSSRRFAHPIDSRGRRPQRSRVLLVPARTAPSPVGRGPGGQLRAGTSCAPCNCVQVYTSPGCVPCPNPISPLMCGYPGSAAQAGPNNGPGRGILIASSLPHFAANELPWTHVWHMYVLLRAHSSVVSCTYSCSKSRPKAKL